MPGGAKPKDTIASVKRLLGYLGKDIKFVITALVCVLVASACTLAGSYILSPIVDDLTETAIQVAKASEAARGEIIAQGVLDLGKGVLIMLCIYGVGIAGTYLQQRIMIGVFHCNAAIFARNYITDSGAGRSLAGLFDTGKI